MSVCLSVCPLYHSPHSRRYFTIIHDTSVYLVPFLYLSGPTTKNLTQSCRRTICRLVSELTHILPHLLKSDFLVVFVSGTPTLETQENGRTRGNFTHGTKLEWGDKKSGESHSETNTTTKWTYVNTNYPTVPEATPRLFENSKFVNSSTTIILTRSHSVQGLRGE